MNTGFYAPAPQSSERQAGWTQLDLEQGSPPPADEPGAAYPYPYPYSQPTYTAEPVDAEAWTTGTMGMPPGLPPTYSDGSEGGRPRRRRGAWKYGLAALLLLAVLVGGIGIGRAISDRGTSGVVIGASSAPNIAGSSSASSLQQTLQNVAAAVEPSVVEITSVGRGQEAIGSGDIITADGYIVTNDHVVDGFNSYRVTLENGQTLPAQLIGTDPQDDLAVIKVAATNLHPIAFADSSKVTVGEFAVAIGNPYGQRETATFGTVSAINRTESEGPDGPAGVLTGLIQTSAPIAPGNSGGALVDIHGQLIGIPTLGQSDAQAASSTTTVGFAIPSNEVKTVAQQIIRSGHGTSTPQGFLGIEGEDVSPAVASADGLSVQSGVLVVHYAADAAGQSPAQQGGLQTGDVIVAINGQTINDSNDLAASVMTQKPGTQVSVTVVRGSSQVTLKVTLGQRRSNAQG